MAGIATTASKVMTALDPSWMTHIAPVIVTRLNYSVNNHGITRPTCWEEEGCRAVVASCAHSCCRDLLI